MLNEFLIGEAFIFLLVFCRIGSGIMLLPGFGESYVPTRVRLVLALWVSLAVMPMMHDLMPSPPTSLVLLLRLMIAEIMVGLFFGLLSRILISAMHVAGTAIAFQSSLSSATMFDYTQASQGSTLGNFLGMAALTLLFATNLHHLMISGIADSYSLFRPGIFPPVEDFANLAAHLFEKTFMIGISIAAPHLVIGLLLYLGGGVLARVMPTMQVFFVIIPFQILGSIFILMTTISAILLWYMGFYQDTLTSLLEPQ